MKNTREKERVENKRMKDEGLYEVYKYKVEAIGRGKEEDETLWSA